MVQKISMGTGTADVVGITVNACSFKVHRSMCIELMKLVAKISRLLPEIEAARPRCSSGIKVLSLLNNAIEKANQLLQYCSESSKLYLAITSDTIISRFQRIRDCMEQSLYEIQNLVPVMLAIQISQLVDDLRNATLTLDSSEEEAGKVMLQLLRQDASASDSLEISELRAIQLAASKLHIASSKALVTERRSIKNLLDKVDDGKKKKILRYLLYLLKKYEKVIMQEQKDRAAQHERNIELDLSREDSGDVQTVEAESHAETRHNEVPNNVFHGDMPPEEFRCPFSGRLMYDPVVIASGRTFERMWIQKWFEEGNDTCPITKVKLCHLSLTPNTVMKDLIGKWCMNYGIAVTDPTAQLGTHHSWQQHSLGSIASFASSMNDLNLHVNLSTISFGSLDINDSHPKTGSGLSLTSINGNENAYSSHADADISHKSTELLYDLSRFPWESQCKIFEDFKYNDTAWQDLSSEDFVKPLLGFLRHAWDKNDIKAQRVGSELLLDFLRKNRSEIPYLNEDAVSLLISFLDSDISGEALSLLELLSSQEKCRSKIKISEAITTILKILKTEKRDLHEAGIRILYNLSTNSNICSHVISTGCFTKLISLLNDGTLGGYSVMIVRNLCEMEECRAAIIETKGCIASIAEILELGSRKNQEHAIAILLSLCAQSTHCCQLVMAEGVIPNVVDISVNGTEKGRVYATELLRELGDIDYIDDQECFQADPGVPKEPENQHEVRRSSSKGGGFLRKLLRRKENS